MRVGSWNCNILVLWLTCLRWRVNVGKLGVTVNEFRGVWCVLIDSFIDRPVEFSASCEEISALGYGGRVGFGKENSGPK